MAGRRLSGERGALAARTRLCGAGEGGGSVNHELVITFEPKEDEEAERIISAVEALGFEIVNAVQIKSSLGREVDRSRRATASGHYKLSELLPEFCCTFCGKEEQEVTRPVAGPVTYICDGCVDLCVEIIRQDDDD